MIECKFQLKFLYLLFCVFSTEKISIVNNNRDQICSFHFDTLFFSAKFIFCTKNGKIITLHGPKKLIAFHNGSQLIFIFYLKNRIKHSTATACTLLGRKNSMKFQMLIDDDFAYLSYQFKWNEIRKKITNLERIKRRKRNQQAIKQHVTCF